MDLHIVEEALNSCTLTGKLERVGNGHGIPCTNPIRPVEEKNEHQPSGVLGKYCLCTVFSEYIRMSPDDVTIDPTKMKVCSYRVLSVSNSINLEKV